MKKSLCAAALAAALVVALAPLAPAGAGAGRTARLPNALRRNVAPNAAGAQEGPLTVQVGAGLGRRVPGFTARAMAPHVDGVATVKVHSGDVVHIVGGMVFIPQGQTPESWADAVTSDPDDPYFPFKADPDPDLPGVQAPTFLNPTLFGPSDFSGCGATADNPCEYDGTNPDPFAGSLNTGDMGEFYIRFTAQPNSEIWSTQPIDWPEESNLLFQVVPNGEEATTQEDVNSARKALKAQDRETALGLLPGLNEVNRHREDGKLVYDVWAGYDEGPILMFAFFPQNLTIPKGATVRYRFDHLNGEIHTATLPFEAGRKVVRNAFVPSCDPDGDGPGPDELANFDEEGPPCPELDQFEFDLGRRLTKRLGDGRFPGGPKTYESSGLEGPWAPTGVPGLQGGSDPWDLKFTKKSDDKGYRYICAVHGAFMSGRVRVR